MRSRADWGRKRLHAMLTRLQQNPFSSEEVGELHRQLEQLEVRMEQLGARARLEREDIERLEAPWRRAILWLSGSLAIVEDKERREYEQALAEVLAEGERVAQVKARLDALDPRPAFDDDAVRRTLWSVEEQDLEAYGELGEALKALRESVWRDQLWWVERSAQRLLTSIEKRRRRMALRSQLYRLSNGLQTAGLGGLAKQVHELAASFDDPLTRSSRRARCQRVLEHVCASLNQLRAERSQGVALRLAECVRDHELPAWPDEGQELRRA